MMVSKFLDPKNDICFKRIFGTEKNKDILIHFINDVMGFEGGDVIEDVTFLSPVQDPDIACKKQSIVDVLCKAVDGTQIIIEMQVAKSPGFEKRAQYYAAKAYVSQLNKGQEEDGLYHNLKSVIFIAITDYVMFEDNEDFLSKHIMLDNKTKKHNLDAFSFTFIELPKFKKISIDQLSNIMEKWCYFFKNAESTSEKDMAKIVGSDEVIEKAYEELNIFNWNEQQRLAYDQELKRVRDNKAVELQKIMDAKDEGIKEGIEQGIEKGIEKVATALLQDGLSSSKISALTGLTVEQIESLKGK